VSAVEVRGLRVELEGTSVDIVDDVSFAIGAGEIVGLVGESGSGKTTIGSAVLGFARRGARIAGGEVLVDGVDVTRLRGRDLARLRGKIVAYIPQDPTAALNPALRIGRQLGEMLEVHAPDLSGAARVERLRECLDEVGLPADDEFRRRYPHQLSGGQQQRVTIAMAFLLRPKVIVLDEPTTGLDVTTQQRVLATVRRLCAAHGVAALYVTHDLSVVANLADRVLVAYAGRVVEAGELAAVFERPAHPYTRRLLATIPDIAARRRLEPIDGHAPAPSARPAGCSFAPRCEFARDVCTVGAPPQVDVGPHHRTRCLRVRELPPPAPPALAAVREPATGDAILAVERLDASYGSRVVLHGVTLELRTRECLALVGESGSGKTTLARSIVGLVSDWRGEIRFKGTPLAPHVRARPMTTRRELQYVFQSPYTALNPRRTIGDSIALPVEHFFGHRGAAADEQIALALEKVSLPRSYADRFPDQLSGGERQRAAIARALACDPEVLICDEVTSALDVSVQAAIVKLLAELQWREGLALLFVTHDLALVRTIADRVLVMTGGRIVETGSTESVLAAPEHAYTRQLLRDTPDLHATTPAEPAPAPHAAIT
jgi:peptide/nickel transport system ATP-binding protein